MEGTDQEWLFTHAAQALYADLLGGGHAVAGAPGLAELEALNLAVPNAGRPGESAEEGGGYIAISPGLAERILYDELTGRLSNIVDQLRALPRVMASLREVREEATVSTGQLVVGHEIDGAVEEMLHRAKEEQCSGLVDQPRVGTRRAYLPE